MHVFIAMPAFGLTNWTATTMALMDTTRMFGARGIPFYFSTQTYPEIDELRNMLLTLWFDRTPECTHLLMIDADMGFPGKLVEDMLAFDQPLVGCVYPQKTYPLKFVVKLKPIEEGPALDRGFLEVDGVGFGVTLVRRDCVQKMLETGAAKSDDRLDGFNYGLLFKEWGCNRLIRAFDRIETPGGRMSEDYSFCQRHRDCGGTVWAATHHKITHVGPHGYAGCFLDRLK